MKVFDVAVSVLLIGLVFGGPYSTLVHESIHMIQCQKSSITYSCSYEPFMKFNQIHFKSVTHVINNEDMEAEARFMSVIYSFFIIIPMLFVLKTIKDKEIKERKWYEMD